MRKRILAVMGVTVMVLGMTTSVGAEEAKADASGQYICSNHNTGGSV